MNKILSALAVLGLFAVIAEATQVGKYECQHHSGGEKKIIFQLLETSTTAVQKLVVASPSCTGSSTFAYDAADPPAEEFVVTTGSGATFLTHPNFPCGVTAATSNAVTTYKLVIWSSSCGDANCLTLDDRLYTATCTDAQFTDQTQNLVASQTSIAGSLTDGTISEFEETVSMEVVRVDGPATIDLGDDIYLKVTLTITAGSGVAQGVRLVSCGAAASSAGAEIVQLMDSDGCAPPYLAIITADKGFTKDNTLSSATEYISTSPTFRAFLFADQTNTMFFKCTAKFCYGADLTTCDTSCDTERGRKRRSAHSDKEMELMVFMEVSIDNKTRVSVMPSNGRPGHDSHDVAECKNQSYVIGLSILGGVLFVSLIVSVCFFALIKRGNHGNQSEKIAYVNKCVS